MSGRTLRAPVRDGAVVAEPSLEVFGALLASNRRRLEHADRHLLGRAWSEVREQARQAALDAAVIYFRQRGEPVPALESARLLLAGHQPELFHPGVWIKNFALNGQARKHGLTPLNLIVDNDTLKTTSLRVPGADVFTASWPATHTIPFDRWMGEVPYEERIIADPALFASFAERAETILAEWNYTPLLANFWREVRGDADRQSVPLLGECFAAARRVLERRWGCHNLEVPLSVICRTEPFAWFACHLLAELPRFHALYNNAVREYRRQHGIRSRHHPVPDLATEDDWLEAPFWGWRVGAHTRGRLFVRMRPERIELRSGTDLWPALPHPLPGQIAPSVTAWRELESRGFKVRSRALTTTLYARLFLADLFLHGIGGGKYDELTDTLIQRFYAIEPPAYVVLSATLWLPLPPAEALPEECQRLRHTLRDVHYNPQRHLDGTSGTATELLAQKNAWIARQPNTRGQRRERFEALRTLTARLRTPLADREKQLRRRLAECERGRRINAVLQRRDYSFCLYPEATLRPFLTQFL